MASLQKARNPCGSELFPSKQECYTRRGVRPKLRFWIAARPRSFNNVATATRRQREAGEIMDCRNRLWRILLLVFSCLATVVGCAAQQKQTYIFMVFSNPVAGQEAAYNHWYDNQHAQDVVAVPDFQEAQRFVRSEIQLRVSAPLPDYLIIYKIVTADLPAVFAEVNRRLDTRMTIIDSSFDKSSSISFTYKVMGPVIYPDRRAGGARPAPSSESSGEALPLYDQLVFADPTAGQEMEFNRWYDHQHAPEVVSAPGFVSAQRYVLSETQYNRRKKPTK